ncbi:Lactoylglutathione lyase [Saitoella coloradoensis]
MSTDLSTYKFNHTMLRVKDPQASLKFYRDTLGMSLVNKWDFEEAKFSLYFLAYDSEGAAEGGKPWSDREGILELTHNHGTENDPDFKPHNGNSDPRGFGHICISVDNIQAACERLEKAGVKFQKRLTDGRQKDIAFPQKANVAETDLKNYRFNHTMIRVKDPQASLKFYTEQLGMEVVRKKVFDEAKFTLYFLAYTHGAGVPTDDGRTNPVADREGILELTHNHGTESDPNFTPYHTGNDEPKGYGHIAISVDNIEAACKRFEENGVTFKKKLTDGRMNNIAFMLDPDGYWIEVIPKELAKE